MAELLPDLSSFKHFTRARQTIAEEIRTLADLLGKRLAGGEAEGCRQLMVKLAVDRFALVVVGQFKRGKSSLMNAVIGRDILPTGVLPLTSAITVLRYGPREKLTILKRGTSYPEEVPISRIAEYVTEKGNPGNAGEVTCASLELPVRFLRRGLEFVDTPGIGSAIEANTETTLDFLPRSDAVIFVTSVDTPLTRAETDFLQTIREHVRKIFFVVNKIDLAADGERQEIMEFIAGTLKRLAQAGELRIFPVSSARFFANRQYELSARESARRAHAASLGFCSLHTWQLEATASPQGLSIGFSNLMERLSADLGRLAASEESNPGESVRALVQDPDHCSVCRLVRDVGKRYLDDLAGFVRTEEGRRAYAYSQGVCLRHLGMLIADMPSRETVRFLLDHAALRFAEIAEDMRNYALKRDALRADMQNQDEKDAYLRAVIRTAGAKRVCFPWDMDQGM